MHVRALAWNLYHGRDHPPDPALLTWRSRLLRTSERNRTHIQVNRDLRDEFSGLLAGSSWDVALLQECPPRWCGALAADCGAEAHLELTSRNSLAALRTLAAKLNPDLIASNEGGSNLTLVRGEIVERRRLELRPGRDPERRVMVFTRSRLGSQPIELCTANLHLSSGRSRQAFAEQETRLAAQQACEWAGQTPLLIGGDFNIRPFDSEVFAELAAVHGIKGTTAADAIDHILGRRLEVVEGARALADSRREIEACGLAIRLSDHAPVEATFSIAELPAQRDDVTTDRG